MMQKYEDRLLDPWIRHYSSLFGAACLTIFDNGSTSERTQALLDKYSADGVKVDRSYDQPQDFIDKGEIIGEAIKTLDRRGSQYDVALALDCDEFLVATGRRVSFDRDSVHDALRSLLGKRQPVVLTEFLNNVPQHGGWFTCGHVPKAIILSGTLDKLDHGFHHPKTIDGGETYSTTRLAHLHLHNRCLEEVRAFAKAKLAPFVDVDDRSAVANWGGFGHHLTKYFIMDERDWLAEFLSQPVLMIPEAVEHFHALGISIEDTLQAEARCSRTRNATFRAPDGEIIDFDPIAWMEFRTDVAAVGLGPLFHFARYGLEEQRDVARRASRQRAEAS